MRWHTSLKSCSKTISLRCCCARASIRLELIHFVSVYVLMCAFVCAHTYSFVVNLYYLYYTSGGQAKDCYFGLSKTISWWWQGHLLHGGSELQHVQRDCTDAWWIRTQALGPVQGQAPWWAFGINLGDILIITLPYYVMRVWFFFGMCMRERTYSHCDRKPAWMQVYVYRWHVRWGELWGKKRLFKWCTCEEWKKRLYKWYTCEEWKKKLYKWCTCEEGKKRP